MRQMLLPVCFCLLTWSSATGSNPGLTLEDYARKEAAPNSNAPIRLASLDVGDGLTLTRQQPAPEENASAIVAIPGAEPVATKKTPDVAEIAALVPDLAAEFPVPSGVVINNGIPIGIPLPPIPKPVVDRSEDEVCGSLAEAAQRNDLPAPFFIRLLFQESRFNAGVVSNAGAQGVAQFMPQTAEQMGVDNPFDPLQAIPASARLLRSLVRQFGNLGLAAAAYNAGPKRVADWLAAKGKSKLPEETQGYVKIITGKPVENWSTASARHPAQKLPQRAPCQSAAGLLAYSGPDALPLPSPSPLRAAIKVADKSDDKKNAKPETTAADAKVVAAIKKTGAAKKTADLTIIAPEPTSTKKNARVALGAKVVQRPDARAELRLDVKPTAKAEEKAEAKAATRTTHKTPSKPEPRKDAPRRERVAQR